MSLKTFNFLTSSEKLLIAIAYDLYGETNIPQIIKFLKYNNIILSNVDEIYKLIKSESEIQGYTSVKKYCQDFRYNKAIEEFEKCKNLIYAVLENKIDLEKIEIPEFENINLGKQTSLFKKVINETLDINFITDNVIKLEPSQNEQPQIEPKNLIKNQKIKVESPKNVKEKKRFYLCMDDEEKIIDDYFDYLDVKNLEGVKNKENLEKVNDVFEIHPLLFKVKEKGDKMSRLLSVDERSKREKLNTIQTPFDQIMYKIQFTRRQDKDKTGWKSEIKVILDHFSAIFEKDQNFIQIYENLEGNSLQYTIMSVMLIIQDCIIEEEDDEKLDEYSEYKRKLASFSDFYKK